MIDFPRKIEIFSKKDKKSLQLKIFWTKFFLNFRCLITKVKVFMVYYFQFAPYVCQISCSQFRNKNVLNILDCKILLIITISRSKGCTCMIFYADRHLVKDQSKTAIFNFYLLWSSLSRHGQIWIKFQGNFLDKLNN